MTNTNRIFAGNGSFGRVPLRPCDRVRSFYIASNFAEFERGLLPSSSLLSSSLEDRLQWFIRHSREYRRILENWKSSIRQLWLFSFQLISRMLVISRKRNTSARYSGKGEAMRSSGRARAVRGAVAARAYSSSVSMACPRSHRTRNGGISRSGTGRRCCLVLIGD